MANCLFDKKVAAQYVSDQVQNLKPNSALTMTIALEKSGVYSVFFVTDTLSDDTEMQMFLAELPTTYAEEQGG